MTQHNKYRAAFEEEARKAQEREQKQNSDLEAARRDEDDAFIRKAEPLHLFLIPALSEAGEALDGIDIKVEAFVSPERRSLRQPDPFVKFQFLDRQNARQGCPLVVRVGHLNGGVLVLAEQGQNYVDISNRVLPGKTLTDVGAEAIVRWAIGQFANPHEHIVIGR